MTEANSWDWTWVSSACCGDCYHGDDQICAADHQDELYLSISTYYYLIRFSKMYF